MHAQSVLRAVYTEMTLDRNDEVKIKRQDSPIDGISLYANASAIGEKRVYFLRRLCASSRFMYALEPWNMLPYVQLALFFFSATRTIVYFNVFSILQKFYNIIPWRSKGDSGINGCAFSFSSTAIE